MRPRMTNARMSDAASVLCEDVMRYFDLQIMINEGGGDECVQHKCSMQHAPENYHQPLAQ